MNSLSHNKSFQLFFGDLHNHCAISYAHGPLKAALENAKGQLDFCSITGHAHWPDMPQPDERIQYIIDFHLKGFHKLKNCWNHYLEEVESYCKEGSFLAFPGYEIHSSVEGDYTFVGKNQNLPLVLENSIESTIKHLHEKFKTDVLAFPHHLGYPLGSRGANWECFNSTISPVVEILSMHGISENCESIRPFYHSMGPIDYEGTVQYALKKGLIFGLIGSTDHHSAYPGSYGHGKMAVWATDLSRNGIWDAIYARRTYALTGDRIKVEFFINNHPMGSVLPSCPEHFVQFHVNAGYPLESIELVKNNRVISTWNQFQNQWPDSNNEIQSKIYLEMGWGEKRSSFDWKGSIKLSKGIILDYESRFRGAEVVSPVEKDKKCHIPFRNGNLSKMDNQKLIFDVTSQGNPTNSTPATQGFSFDFRAPIDACVELEIHDQTFSIPINRLLVGSFARNLGNIDSPAFRLHRLPSSNEINVKGQIALGQENHNDFYYLRVKQKNQQYAVTSPVFFIPVQV